MIDDLIRDIETAPQPEGDPRVAAMDGMLATACSRFLQAAAAINCMRLSIRAGDSLAAVAALQAMNQHLDVANHTLVMITKLGLSMQTNPNGGIVH